MIQSTIQQAMVERKVLRISYVDSKGKHTVRSVEPYEIKGGKLWAHCLQRHAIRQFDLNKVVNAIVGDKHFTPRHEVKHAPFA